jgi:transcriptional regulator
MHRNPAFRWSDRSAMLAFVAETAFAHLFAQLPEGPRVAHVPVTVTPQGNLRLHLARANPLAGQIDGLTAIASIAGPDAYVSPDWYGSDDQVPTWNYVAVEAEGAVRRLTEDELVAQVDDLSATHEQLLLPKTPWTRAKMTPGLFEKMLQAIVGFELQVADLRGTVKMGQNKRRAEMEGAAAGLEGAGRIEVAAMMRTLAKARP